MMKVSLFCVALLLLSGCAEGTYKSHLAQGREYQDALMGCKSMSSFEATYAKPVYDHKKSLTELKAALDKDAVTDAILETEQKDLMALKAAAADCLAKLNGGN